MKIDGSDSVLASHDHMKALQDRIQELKRAMGPRMEGDRTTIQPRRSFAGQGHEISFEDAQNSLARIRVSGQGGQLGALHGNLNMDRVRELLSPLG